MRWRVCTIGKPALAYAKSGTEEYLKRLQRYAPVEIVTGREGGQDANSLQLLKASEGTHRIALDERGEAVTTQDWVERINRWELDSVKTVSLLIGGADGHSEELRRQCAEIWSFSGLTLQHELALLVTLEGLYRCYTIKRGEPYHR